MAEGILFLLVQDSQFSWMDLHIYKFIAAATCNHCNAFNEKKVETSTSVGLVGLLFRNPSKCTKRKKHGKKNKEHLFTKSPFPWEINM